MFFANNLYNLRYIGATFSYGFARKAIQMWNATRFDSNDYQKKEPIPILNTHKLVISTLSGSAALYIWPYYLYNDLSRLEIYLKNQNPESYGFTQPRYELDYLFN